jgi:ribosomal protein L30/L7E
LRPVCPGDRFFVKKNIQDCLKYLKSTYKDSEMILNKRVVGCIRKIEDVVRVSSE